MSVAAALLEMADNAATVIAVLVGGGWALYTYYSLYQPDVAEAQASRRFSRLGIEIDASTQNTPEGTCIFATACIENIGTRPVYYSHRWGKLEDIPDPQNQPGLQKYHPPLAVYRIGFESSGAITREAGKEVLDKCIPGHPLTIPASPFVYRDGKEGGPVAAVETWGLIRVGEKRRIPFAVRVTEPGTYLVAYRINVRLSAEERRIYKQHTDRDSEFAVWSARTFVVVDQVKHVTGAALIGAEPGTSA